MYDDEFKDDSELVEGAGFDPEVEDELDELDELEEDDFEEAIAEEDEMM